MSNFNPVKHWSRQINRMLEKKKYKFASDTLEGIYENINRRKSISQKQIDAIKNISQSA